MDDVAEKVARFINASFIVILINRTPSMSGVRFADGINTENVGREVLSEFLKSQLNGIAGEKDSLKKVVLSGNRLPWPSFNQVQTLAFLRISENVSRIKKGFGSIYIGIDRPLEAIDEVALVAASQRLGELGRISELEADIQIRNQFLSIASHELKTPLTSIYGILQLQERMLRLKKEQAAFPDQERHHNFLKMVIRQVERLNELIDGLLDVSRIQNGRFMVEPMDTDVAALIHDATQARLSVIAQEAGVKINVDSVPSLVAWVDPVRMEEVIINLVMNAIRFSPEGGVVWVKLREEGGAFRLTIRDQGPSIPMEDRERIFQPFERAQRTSRMGGLGLGLFISRQIAQLHGGNVSLVESVPGKGNVFEAYFPIRQPHLVTASA
jgi:signal transduction histidine kinase